MNEVDINRCQIQEWYPNFKSISIKTLIHELPESFIQYLLDDSGPFLLPLSIANDDALPNRVHNPKKEEDFVTLEGSEDEAEEPGHPPSFPDLETKIKTSIPNPRRRRFSLNSTGARPKTQPGSAPTEKSEMQKVFPKSSCCSGPSDSVHLTIFATRTIRAAIRANPAEYFFSSLSGSGTPVAARDGV
ncbi:cell division cycle protein 123 homolog, partial [Phtheirospermum japonicum]